MRALCLLAVGLACGLGCKAERPARARCLTLPPSDSPVVARVGDAAITAADVERRLREQGSAAQRFSDEAGLRRLVEDQVRFELLAQAALERGLDKDPDVVDAARKMMVRKLLARDLGAQVFADAESEAAVERYYADHIDDYQRPERRRLAHIQLDPTPEGHAFAQSLLDKLAAAPERDKLFRLLVAQHSRDAESTSRGGELGAFISRDELEGKLGKSFADEVFALPAGELPGAPVQSTRGWHVVALLAKRDSSARSLDEVRDDIRERLLASRRSQMFERYLGEIRQRHPVALYDDRLPELSLQLSSNKGR